MGAAAADEYDAGAEADAVVRGLWGEDEEAAAAREEQERKAKWAARRDGAAETTAAGLEGFAAVAPMIAQGIRLTAQGAACMVMVGGYLVTSAVQALSSDDRAPMEISDGTRDALATAAAVAMAGASAAQAVKNGVIASAEAIGGCVVRQLASESDEDDPIKHLGAAAVAAAEGARLVKQEIREGQAVIAEKASQATCSAVEARYGAEAGEALGDALDVLKAAKNIKHSAMSPVGAAALAASRGAQAAATTAADTRHPVGAGPQPLTLGVKAEVEYSGPAVCYA